MHPESGKPITASIGRYGPYLAHDGKYARLKSTAEVFDTGMNAAVVRLAEAASGAARVVRGAAEPLKTFGPHPTSGGEIKLMSGRWPLCDRRHDQCDAAARQAARNADGGRSGGADRRARGQGPCQGQEEGGQEGWRRRRLPPRRNRPKAPAAKKARRARKPQRNDRGRAGE
jgi:DNA topoisomerase-1